jgi:hypothetical protein
MRPFYTPVPFGELIPAIMKDNIGLEEENPGTDIGSFSPIDNFRLLLEKDYEIRQFIMNFRKDASCYFEDLQKEVRTLFESLLDVRNLVTLEKND